VFDEAIGKLYSGKMRFRVNVRINEVRSALMDNCARDELLKRMDCRCMNSSAGYLHKPRPAKPRRFRGGRSVYCRSCLVQMSRKK